MSAREHDDGSILAWTIPPAEETAPLAPGEAPVVEVRRLADELEIVCQPESVSIEIVPAGISRIHLRFADREAAFRVFDAARSRVRAHPRVVRRVAASTGRAKPGLL